MAYRRRRMFKRKPFRRYRRRRIFKRSIKNSTRTHYFKRTKVDEFTITNAGFVSIKSDVADAVYNKWQLDQLPEYTEFTTLYDEYKICALKCRFVFDRNSAEVASANAELPQLITVFDQTDTTALANEAEALQYSSFKSVRLNRPITRYFKTRMEGSTNLIKAGWNGTHYSNAGHYGMKVAVDTISAGGGTTLGTLRVYTTFYLGMRKAK